MGLLNFLGNRTKNGEQIAEQRIKETLEEEKESRLRGIKKLILLDNKYKKGQKINITEPYSEATGVFKIMKITDTGKKEKGIKYIEIELKFKRLV